jgi:hypothetical protein
VGGGLMALARSALRPLDGFIGPSNTLASWNVDVERTVNQYVEGVAPGTSKVPAWLAPRPGLTKYVVLGAGPVRGLGYQDGRCFAVGGAGFYEPTATHTATYRGAVRVDGRPASLFTNGSAGDQWGICSGGLFYVFDMTANTLTNVTLNVPSPAAMGGFVDGYGVILKRGSRQFQISALEDFTTWDALDVFEVSQNSDNLRALIVVHNQLWLMGSQTYQIWTDVGDADTPFQPIPGSLGQQGICGEFAWAVNDNTLYWVSANSFGAGQVFRAVGYQPERISTHAVELALQNAPRLEDTICWSYQVRGHVFIVVYVPTLSTSWVYDTATNLWHEEGIWNVTAGDFEPHLGRCSIAAFNNAILVGDRLSPAIYQIDPDVSVDGQVRLVT